MTDDRGTLRSIVWRELCPWLLIFRTFTFALTLPLLLLAALAVAIQPLGWRAAEVFLSSEALTSDPALSSVATMLSAWPISHADSQGMLNWRVLAPGAELRSADPQSLFYRLSFPLTQLFRIDLDIYKFCYFLFGGLWTLLLWSFVGGVVTRMAVVYLGREERISFKDAVVFVATRYLSYVTAPLYPLLGVALLSIPVALLGLAMYLDLGVLVAGILWFFVLLATLAMAFVLLGLFFGWPLMWPTISAENGEAFEAMSRAYGYTLQRPWHYLFFAIVSALFGSLCWFFISLFADWTVHLAWWGVSWGTGLERLAEIQRAAATGEDIGAMMYGGTRLINFFNGLVYCVAQAFGYCLFFSLSSAVYLLLRQVDDETEFDEVYVEEDEDRLTLPQLQTDAADVPSTSNEGATAEDAE